MHASWILWVRVRAMAVMWGWLWPWMSLKTAMSSFISSTVGVLMLRMALATIQAPPWLLILPRLPRPRLHDRHQPLHGFPHRAREGRKDEQPGRGLDCGQRHPQHQDPHRRADERTHRRLQAHPWPEPPLHDRHCPHPHPEDPRGVHPRDHLCQRLPSQDLRQVLRQQEPLHRQRPHPLPG